MCILQFSVTAICIHENAHSGAMVDNQAYVDIACFTQNYILKFGTPSVQTLYILHWELLEHTHFR